MIYAQLAENKEFAAMSDKAQKTYIFLIVLGDDEGRVKGDSDWLRIKIFPYDQGISKEDMQGFIREIVKARLIKWYKMGTSYFIQHPNWTRYQILRSDRKKDSDIPPPDDNQVTTKRVRKLSKDKIREDKGRENLRSLAYLDKIPEEDVKYFTSRFDMTRRQLESKAESMKAYCQAHGKTYKDYRALLLNSVKGDFAERRNPTTFMVEERKELDPATRAKMKEIGEHVREIAGAKKITP